MSRRMLVVAVVALVLVAGVLAFLLSRPAPKAPETDVARTETPAPAPAPKPAAPKTSPAPAPAAPRRSREAPAPAPEPAPAPPPVVDAAPDTGTLRIDADVPGAQVFLDRQFVGTAPVTAANVKPGSHQLNVSATGYDGVAQTIDVEPGPRDVKIRFKEVRLDARIDVVHKHRMGSCKGRLVATPQSIRYDASEKDDAFSIPLADLDVFQVDYMEKNLKVKGKGGRQYNFTDPEGNADHLFVFHRDVEKVRERLKRGDTPAEN